MNPLARRGGSGLIALIFIATASASAAAPTPPAGDVTIASIPLFARMASDGDSLRTYKVPVHMSGWLHKFIFTFHFQRDGMASFAQPASLQFVFDSVPQKYTQIFGQLGTPRTWPAIYNLQCVKTEQVDGVTQYEIHGVPKDPSSDIDYVVIRMNDHVGPITAQWFLRDGWNVTSTIQMESVGNYLLPKEDDTVVTGHGYNIHSDVTYGNYELNSAA